MAVFGVNAHAAQPHVEACGLFTFITRGKSVRVTGAPEFSCCLEPILKDVVSAVPATLLIEFVGTTGDISVGHDGRERIGHTAGRDGTVVGSSSLRLVHDDFYLFKFRVVGSTAWMALTSCSGSQGFGKNTSQPAADACC